MGKGLSTSPHFKPTKSHISLSHSSHVKNAIPYFQLFIPGWLCSKSTNASLCINLSLFFMSLRFNQQHCFDIQYKDLPQPTTPWFTLMTGERSKRHLPNLNMVQCTSVNSFDTNTKFWCCAHPPTQHWCLLETKSGEGKEYCHHRQYHKFIIRTNWTINGSMMHTWQVGHHMGRDRSLLTIIIILALVNRWRRGQIKFKTYLYCYETPYHYQITKHCSHMFMLHKTTLHNE